MKEPGGAGKKIFSEEERTTIRFAEKLTAWPGSVQDEDLEALGKFFNAEQIAELVLTIATANMTNRINDGLRTPVDV